MSRGNRYIPSLALFLHPGIMQGCTIMKNNQIAQFKLNNGTLDLYKQNNNNTIGIGMESAFKCCI